MALSANGETPAAIWPPSQTANGAAAQRRLRPHRRHRRPPAQAGPDRGYLINEQVHAGGMTPPRSRPVRVRRRRHGAARRRRRREPEGRRSRISPAHATINSHFDLATMLLGGAVQPGGREQRGRSTPPST
jgi:hypothetical protein